MSSLPLRIRRSEAPEPRGGASRQAEQQDTMDTEGHGRANSNSSASSEDPFVFSPHQTPAHEQSSFLPTPPAQGASNLASPAPHSARFNGGSFLLQPNKVPTTSFVDSPTTHSRPIAIELPPSLSRRIAGKPVYTPIAPVSGRGDLPGGYFPFHEDPNERITRPHPFHIESQDAQKQESEHIFGQNPRSAKHPPAIALHSYISKAPASISRIQRTTVTSAPMSFSGTSAPLIAYLPSGHHGVPQPLGKYYPSNYEASRSRKTSNQNTSHTSLASQGPSSSGGSGPSSHILDMGMPQYTRSDSSHARSDSEAKRRLQQYQRDMVAQATQATRHLAGARDAANLARAHGIAVQNFQAGSTKPVSPRLQPLGSPGPVTPMELEGQGADEYLNSRKSAPSPDGRRHSEAVAKVLKAEQERRRREGTGSPTVEAGGFF